MIHVPIRGDEKVHSVFFIFTHMCKSVKNFKYKCILLRDHAEIQKCKCKSELPVHLRKTGSLIGQSVA
jgi:hypothetical protein